MSRTVCFLAIIIALHVLLQRLGILNLPVPSQLADSGMGYGMLFVVGLVTFVHCVAMCGGINLSQGLPQGGNTEGQRLLPSIFYNLGRVISYTVIGFLLGLVGLVLGLSMLSQGGALSGMLLPDRLLFPVIGPAVVGAAASVPIPHKIYRIACVALSVIVTAAVGIIGQRYNSDDPAPEGPTVRIVDGVQEITSTAAFFPIQVDGTDTEVFAIRASDGTVRTAFNTCQSCFLSGRGYCLQNGDDLVCQNRGFHFTPDQAEIQSGGCDPWPIFANYKTAAEDTIQISYEFLKSASGIFGNWKR